MIWVGCCQSGMKSKCLVLSSDSPISITELLNLLPNLADSFIWRCRSCILFNIIQRYQLPVHVVVCIMTLNKCVAKGTTDILGLSKAKWRHKRSIANKILSYEILTLQNMKGTVSWFVTPSHLILIYFCFEVTHSTLMVQYVSKFLLDHTV